MIYEFRMIIFILMQNISQKSAKSTSRPLLFNTKADIHMFVHGNNSQTSSMNIPTYPQKPSPSFYPNSSLFDRYNKPGLLLRDCDAKDVIQLNKNLIMYEQPISDQLIRQIQTKAEKVQKKSYFQTGQALKNFHIQQNLLKTTPQVIPSREYTQNQIFFNYKEMADIKRQQKKTFLSEIQNRIAQAEKQIEGLQQLQEEQKLQMHELNKFQRKVGEELTKNVEIGKIKVKVGYVTGYQEPEIRQPISIHPQMQPQQINEVLDQHFKLNEDVLEMAGNARLNSKEKYISKELNKEKHFGATTSFKNTFKRPGNQSKNLVSTMKTQTKPPKNKNKK